MNPSSLPTLLPTPVLAPPRPRHCVSHYMKRVFSLSSSSSSRARAAMSTTLPPPPPTSTTAAASTLTATPTENSSKKLIKSSSPWGLAQLSDELVLEMGGYVQSRRDIFHLCLAGHRLHNLLLPNLYSSIDVQSIEQCRKMLTLLLERPDRARLVQKLFVAPSYLKEESPQVFLDENWVADIIIRMAPNLHRLHTFMWCGLESPTDSLWDILRTHCPLLKSVGSTIGARPVDPDSHLFDFTGLVGFALIVTWRRFSTLNRPVENFPDRLWEMLLHRSPNLQELTLGGPTWSSPRLFDVRPVTKGRWPKLTTLKLGDTLMRNELDEHPCHFTHFLKTHPTLECLHVPGTRHFPRNPFLSDASFLPALESYTGPFTSLPDFPHPGRLKSLWLTTDDLAAFYTPFLCHILSRLTSLTSLAIWVDLSYGDTVAEQDHCGMLGNILRVCPGLRHLEVLCSTKSKLTFRFEEFSIALRNAPQLKTIVLQKVHKFDDIDMVQSAARLVRENPGLEQVTLRSTLSPWSNFSRTFLRKIGTYDVIRDDPAAADGSGGGGGGGSGKPVRLLVVEKGMRLFGRVTLQYTYNMTSLRRQVVAVIARKLRSF